MSRLDVEESPELAIFVRYLGEDEPEIVLDSDLAIERALHEILPTRGPEALDRLSAQITRAIDDGPPDDTAFANWLGMSSPPPGGIDRRAWLRYVQRYAATYRGASDVPVPDYYEPHPPLLSRASRFHDLDTANLATTGVLRAHESRFRAWAADPKGTWRLHLYADLHRDLGVYLEGRDARVRLSAQPQPASACVVLMKIDHETRQPFVATAYPERDLPAGPRASYPDLAQFFGGYFSQDYPGLDTAMWGAENNFNSCVAEPVRRRVADQLALLLTEDDAALRVSVDALGSYALPVDLRRWVTGLRRRMLWMDWQGDGPLEPEV